MTTEQYRTRSGLSIFLSFFMPHRGLFFLDLACALVVALIDLAYPIVSRYAMRTLLPQNAYRAFFTVMLVVVAAYALRALLFAPGQEMPLPRLQLALFELRDMELIEMTESPFAVRLKQVAGKRDFYATATGRWLREEIHIDDMGGCKNGKDGS